jgi:hypothetical protein
MTARGDQSRLAGIESNERPPVASSQSAGQTVAIDWGSSASGRGWSWSSSPFVRRGRVPFRAKGALLCL